MRKKGEILPRIKTYVISTTKNTCKNENNHFNFVKLNNFFKS